MAKFSPKDIDFIFSSYVNYEKYLLDYLRIVPYNEENKNSWSPEIISLFLNICGLIESISVKILDTGTEEKIRLTNGETKYQKLAKDLNIDDFESNIFRGNELLDSRIVLYIYSIFPNCIIKPFNNYREKHNGWWSIYNKLKHNRLENYEQANLDNVIRSLASLFLLIAKNKNDEEFTKSLIRLEMLKTKWVPEYAHKQRVSEKLGWVNSELFATPDDNKSLNSDNLDEIHVFTNNKLSKFIGRLNQIDKE